MSEIKGQDNYIRGVKFLFFYFAEKQNFYKNRVSAMKLYIADARFFDCYSSVRIRLLT